MSIEIVIDPNVRIAGGRTYAGLEDVAGGFVMDLSAGDVVTVVEEESDVVGSAVIYEIDYDKHLIYLEVDWSSLHPRPVSSGHGGAAFPLVRANFRSPLLERDVDRSVASAALAFAG